ncbi:hypothetical protein [Methylosinus sp. Sm6]|uniref:hypothetical protein n=1 Tax=Methylosinus sp. Sm6 TaxID=2866948 RepID=UPI001C9A2307|nr:hypothetical protein [Methylosinus sp. Sm6]MBY6243915.1 hypothetical protein [Methylosinus sp. Sm6]
MREIAITARPLNWRKWTAARARRATLDRLEKIANLHAEIAMIWGDVDESIVSTAEVHIQDTKYVAEELQMHWDDSLKDEGGAAS